MRGRDVLLEVLAGEGVAHVFGNPGSTELSLIDALSDRAEPQYVLGLQEATVVGMADGYAQATGRPAFVNLHTAAGLGNGMGALANARANGAPLVVTAGQQDRRHLAADPLLSGDLPGIVHPVARWALEVRTADEIGVILRRAFHDAASWPRGPVFVSLPMDLMEQETAAPVPPPSTIDRRVVPADLERLAGLLASCAPGRLALVAGDEVAASGGVAAMVALAEAVGAPVHAAALHATMVFPPAHPLFAGPLAPTATAMAATLGRYERVFLVGGRGFTAYPYTPGPAVPPEVELVHLSPDPAELGRTHATVLGLVGDPAATLEALVPLVRARVDAARAAAALEDAAGARRAALAANEETARSRYDQVPMHPMAAVHAVLRALPDDSIVVDEAITAGSYVRGFHHARRAGRYFFCKGAGLGWGMPAAVGISLGARREPVVCLVGDGAALYSPQALWTAAHEQLPVVFVVVNNRQYLILRNALQAMRGDSVRTGRFVAMDLVEPAVDFVSLAGALGVPGESVAKAGDVGEAVRAALDSAGPRLVELPVALP